MPPDPLRNTRTLAHILLLATALVWGATFTLVKSALNDASPLLFNLLRFLLATLALILVNRKHLRHVTRANLAAGAIAGLFLTLGYQLQTVGLAYTTPSKSAFVTGLVVVFVPGLTLIPTLRPTGTPRPGLAAAAGATLAFTGLILITTPAGTHLRNLLATIGRGDLLTLAASLAFAAHLLTLARVSRGLTSGLLATLQIGFATLLMLLTLPLQHLYLHPTPALAIALLICSLLATAAAFTIQSFAQKVLPPTHTVLLLTLEPVFGVITSILVLHETLTHRSLLGAALILSAILLIEFAPATHSTEIPA